MYQPSFAVYITLEFMSNAPPYSRKLSLVVRLILVAVLAVLVSPLIVYMAVFGVSISHDHTRWGEMGSAMSGIYSPILAFLALRVVYGQLRSQNRFNEHEIDQRYVEQGRSDLHFYLEQLDRALQVRDPNGATLRAMLHDHFLFREKASFEDAQRLAIAQSLNRQYPQLLGIWGAIYPVWVGLDSQKRYPYQHNAVGALQKMVAVASFETCVALDQYHMCVTKGRVKLRYQFSPLLSSAT